MNPYAPTVAAQDVETRAAFITRTYAHLFGAIGLFTIAEILLIQSGAANAILPKMLGAPWLLWLGLFMVAGWMARRVAHQARSPVAQYGALLGYVVAEVIIFLPLLAIANQYAPGAIQVAAQFTLIGFAGLTGIAFYTRKDFSFLRGILMWGGVVALLLILGGALFGLHLGVWFMAGMVALSGAAILYDTSNVLHHYPEDRHIAASLELFASVALMFWYVLQLVMNDD